MFDKRIFKMIEENPKLEFLKKILENGILVISPNAEKYLNDREQLYYQSNKKISKQLIVDMLSHDDSYNLLKRIYEEGLWAVIIMFISEKGEFINQYSVSRKGLIRLLNQIDIKQVPSISKRYNEFMNYVSYDKYKEKVINDTYNVIIENNSYSIPVKDILSFMDLSDEEFNNIVNNSQNYNYNVPINYFLYAINKFYIDNKVLDNYEVSESIKSKLKSITSSEKIDVQMINQYIETKDSLLEKISINEELENEILNDLPLDYNDLEKAIYVYIKICKLLTYDEEFYAVNQKGPLAEKHKTIDNISNISLSNNKVVCYEFNAIYAHILNKLGINYKNFVGTINENGDRGEEEFDEEFDKYSNGHTFLKFRGGKYLVKADSVTSILQGDMMQAKLNQPLKGLVCENINEESKKEFSETMNKVYNYISNRELKISQNKAEEIETFEEIVLQFINVTDKLKPIDINEKIDILINKVNSTKMIGIDAYSYLLQLVKIIFTLKEQQDNIKVSIIRDSNNDATEAIAIISIRLPNKDKKMSVNRYIFKPGSKLTPISKEELQANFDNNTMGYVAIGDPKIPGIRK